jgi:hypothetical protein
MLVNTETRVTFPRRILAFEVSLQKYAENSSHAGLHHMLQGMLSHCNSESALLTLLAITDFGKSGYDTSKWLVEAVEYCFMRCSFLFMVSSVDFPIHQDGSEVRIVRTNFELESAIEGEFHGT